MASGRIFPPKLDYFNFKYFRVSKEDLPEFNAIEYELVINCKKKKATSKKVLNRYFSLKRNVLDPESRNYFRSQSASEEKIVKYFKDDPDYYFKEESVDYNRIKEVIEKAGDKVAPWLKNFRYKGFDFMNMYIIESLLRIDREIQFSKNDCIKTAFKMLYKYRSELMSPAQRKMYKKDYKLAVIAACIAHRVFDLVETDMTIEFRVDPNIEVSKAEYYQIGKYAMQTAKREDDDFFKNLKS
jgi:hypothetical protein